MALYCAGLLLLAVLVTRSPWFGLFALTGYIHTYELLSGRWRVVGVTATAALHVLAIFGGRLPDPNLPAVAAYLVLVAVSAGLALGFSRWSEITTSQNEQRKRIIVELAEANAKLEAAMAENASSGPAAGPGAGGRDAGRAPAHGPRDPRHPGPGPHRDHHPGAGGRPAAGRPDDWPPPRQRRRPGPESLAEARRTVEAVGPGRWKGRVSLNPLADVVARWSELGSGPRSTRPAPSPAAPGVEVALPHRPGSPGQHGQARRRLAGPG